MICTFGSVPSQSWFDEVKCTHYFRHGNACFVPRLVAFCVVEAGSWDGGFGVGVRDGALHLTSSTTVQSEAVLVC